MRLKPPITADQAYRQLALNATLSWGLADAAAMDSLLLSMAEAMAVVGALDIPDEVEPLFGEDIGRDPGAVA